MRKESGRRKISGDLLGKTSAVHPYRAPSAKVKEKSRSKSPRSKSPPPDARKKDGKAKRKEVGGGREIEEGGRKRESGCFSETQGGRRRWRERQREVLRLNP